MTHTKLSRTIRAPATAVFEMVANATNYTEAVPEIVKVGFLTDQRSGVGTRFRETRVMGRREATTELEVTEYVANERIRMVSDAGGTVWDTLFTVTPVEDGDATRLELVMEAKPYRLRSRILVPLMKRAVAKAVAGDMDAVKAHLEAR